MVIQCESCSTRFRLPDAKLKPEGVKVRCSHCKTVFTVFPPAAEEPSGSPTSPPAPAGQVEVAAPPQPESDQASDDFGISFDETESEEPGAFAFDSPVSEEEEPSAAAGAPEEEKDDFGFDFSENEGGDGGEAPNEFSFDDSGWGEEGASAEPAAEKAPTEFSFDEASWDESGGDESAEPSGGPRELSFDESPFTDNSDGPDMPSFGESAAAAPGVKDFRFTELSALPGAHASGGGAAEFSPGFGEDLDLPPAHDHDLASSVPEPPVRRKKSSSPTTLFILLLLLVLVAGAGGFFLWQQGQLPMVDEVLNRLRGSAVATGRVEVTNLDFSVVAHPSEGSLSVIRGLAINQYPEPRSALQVKGGLYGAGSRTLAQQLAYCGNPLDDAALRRMSFEQIREKMGNQFGEALANLDVPPGKGIPFTIVFKGVPEGLVEFGVSAVDSQAVSR